MAGTCRFNFALLIRGRFIDDEKTRNLFVDKREHQFATKASFAIDDANRGQRLHKRQAQLFALKRDDRGLFGSVDGAG